MDSATALPVPAAAPVQGAPVQAPLPPWHAQLDLRFARQGHATRAVHRSHRGPLRVQRMLYPEGADCCHALLLHPPGGLAGGDVLQIDVALEPHAHALLTTPGAAKWYRCTGPGARQSLRLGVAAGACLEWLPQEAILFDGARASQQCEIDLQPGAAMFGWDIVQLGRLAGGERWRSGHWSQHLALRREGRLAWLERAQLDAADALRDSPLGLAGHPVFASAWATSPMLSADPAAALALARQAAARHALPCGITWLPAPAELLVVRVLGHDGQGVRALLENVWHTLRPCLAARTARRPRIWAT